MTAATSSSHRASAPSPAAQARPARAARPASRTEGHLVPRRVRFDFRSTPLEWIPGHPFASHFINEINLLLPGGERWFCKVFNQALPLVTDEKLAEDVRLFIRQEAMHAQAHAKAVVEYLDAHGIETQSNLDQEDWIFSVLLGDEPAGLTVPAAAQHQWLLFRLGIIAGIEHMTCVLGNYALRNRAWDDAGADPTLLDLLRWHGAEEVEHRSVAFDLYQHLGGGYLSRYYLASIVMPAIFGLWAHGAAHLMKQDPRFAGKRPSAFRPWIWLEWERTSRTGMLPSLLTLLRQELSFFSPWYDPRREGSTEEALAYLARSPAARGSSAVV